MTKEDFVVKYTTKDIMDKLDIIESKVSHTNGRVRLHTKLIWASFGFTTAVLTAFIAHLI